VLVSSSSETSLMKALASRMAHGESSKPGAAAAVLDVTPTRQALSRSMGEPRLEASKTAGGPDGAGDWVDLAWLRGLGEAAGEGMEDGGAAWATADTAPQKAIKTAVKMLRRKVPLHFSALHSTRRGLQAQRDTQPGNFEGESAALLR